MGRAYVVDVTWDKKARCDVKQIAISCSDSADDSPEGVIKHILTTQHHRRGTKYFYPLTAKIAYEADEDSMPKVDPENPREPQPLSAPPKKLDK